MAIENYTTAVDVRRASKTGRFTGVTAGLAPRQVQANLLILPKRYADDFRNLCQRNPVACPLIGENTAPGDPTYEGVEGDIRYDIPGYNIYKNGKLVIEDTPDCAEWWQDDSVAFFIGCSYTFENALTAAGLTPRHQELGRNVPMYKSNIPLCPAGVFQGCTVVSMRPYKAKDVERVRAITRPYIQTHGEPVAWVCLCLIMVPRLIVRVRADRQGPDAAKQLGIADIMKPDFGDAPVLKEDEVPVFWACGVTPQLAVMSSPEVQATCIGHAPGKMLCLDLTIDELLSR